MRFFKQQTGETIGESLNDVKSDGLPRMEYSLTALGESAIPVIMQMGYRGEEISTFD